jgi:hypothetical protein
MNAVEIEEAISALAEQPFDAQEFPFAFLEAFGNKPTTIKRLRAGASNKSDLGGVLQTNHIHIAVGPPGAVTIPTIECGFFFAISPTSLVQKYRVTSHGRLAGYDDVNDAERLRHDPASTAHGLRKAAARRLAEAGCTMHEIAAITGHASLSEVQRYRRAADQARLARAAMDKAK